MAHLGYLTSPMCKLHLRWALLSCADLCEGNVKQLKYAIPNLVIYHMFTWQKSETQRGRAPKMPRVMPLLLADRALAAAKLLYRNIQDSLNTCSTTL